MVAKLPIDKRSPKDFWDDQHKSLAAEPLAWTLSADELLRSFELLVAQEALDAPTRRDKPGKYLPPIHSVAMMLAGFAIENLLKAIHISSNPAFNASGKFDVATHDLLKLADGIDLFLTEKEKVLLERLEQFLTWAGRYPVPLFTEDMRPRTFPSGGGSAPRNFVMIGSDFSQIHDFAKKLRDLLPTINDSEESN